MGKKLGEIVDKVIVEAIVIIILPVISFVASYVFLQFGYWSVILAIAVFSSLLAVYLYRKLLKEQKARIEAIEMHGQVKAKSDGLVQEINALKKDIKEKERVAQSLSRCEEENRKLKVSVPSNEPGYRELESGEYELKIKKSNLLPSWKSNIYKGLRVGDKIRVGVSSDSKILCHIVKVRSDTDVEATIQSEPALMWRHTYDIAEEGDYAVFIYAVDKDSLASIKIDYYDVGRFLGSRACMEVGAW